MKVETTSVATSTPLPMRMSDILVHTRISKKKRDLVEEDCSTTKHIHHAHKREPATQIVAVTETVYVNADGEVVTQNTQATSQQTTTTTPTLPLLLLQQPLAPLLLLPLLPLVLLPLPPLVPTQLGSDPPTTLLVVPTTVFS
ncbi:uncharacterized protein CYBJADRAFT_99443 [Cyberlindnera jadinii NRRL Y-1542]|uniref:Uncharacterized protein n=1 Tax=Cyberlindnera jadinii (strain ATCC 18201 / CBS 1600 / BCRC 20928 / JCM 3617 / NBRC 0987 / NRRL Y-1542) TaxID=983966 RepID=A0A1E4RZN7_CYBJN|nr:hypothetical protein CYBJADRAFT_99443 [Cyberlindnera jadinii NRRL Y-1542]ODV72702.1 hypothetical protein CYBJADRAFT_99443 [Cyberlindnera jadinii NRRL Y-1542]